MADDEAKAILNQIASVLPTLATKKDLEQVKAVLEAKIDVESRVINARLDEQGRILVAMIPTGIAAVPPAAE